MSGNSKLKLISQETAKLYNFHRKSLNKDENLALFKEYYETNNPNIREEIILGNIKFAASMACKFIPLDSSYDQDDLLQIAIIALIKSVDSFDYTRGYSFTSYAGRIINNELMMLWRKYKNLPIILNLEDAPLLVKSDDSISYTDMVSNPNINIEEDYIYEVTKSLILSKLDILSERNKNIICDYFGLTNNQKISMQKLGIKYNLTQPSISRIIQKSLSKIKFELLLGI